MSRPRTVWEPAPSPNITNLMLQHQSRQHYGSHMANSNNSLYGHSNTITTHLSWCTCDECKGRHPHVKRHGGFAPLHPLGAKNTHRNSHGGVNVTARNNGLAAANTHAHTNVHVNAISIMEDQEQLARLEKQIQQLQKQIKRDRSDFQAKLTLKEKTQTELEKKLVRKETQVKKLDEFSRSLLDKLNHTKRDLQLGDELSVQIANTNNHLKQELHDLTRIEMDNSHLVIQLDQTKNQLDQTERAHQHCHLIAQDAERLKQDVQNAVDIANVFKTDLRSLEKDMESTLREKDNALHTIEEKNEEITRLGQEIMLQKQIMKAKDTEIQELVSQTIANDGETDKYQHIIKLKDQEVNTLKNKLKVTRDDLIGLTKAHRNCSLVKEELGWTKEKHVAAEARTRQLRKLIQLKPYLGLMCVEEPDEGTLLTEVKPGYAAYQCGLRTNDVVVQINGIDTLTKAKFFHAMLGVTPGQAMIFKMIKEGKDLVYRTLIVRMGAVGHTLEEVMAWRKAAGLIDTTTLTGLVGLQQKGATYHSDAISDSTYQRNSVLHGSSSSVRSLSLSQLLADQSHNSNTRVTNADTTILEKNGVSMIRHGKTDELSRSKHYKYTSSPHKHRSLDVHNHSHLVHPTGTSSFDRNNNSYSHNQSKRGGRGGSNSGVIDRTNLNVSFSPGKHKKYQHHSLTYFKHNLHNIDEDAKANNTYANDTEHKHADTDNMPANLKELSSIMRQTNNASLLSMY